MTDHSRRSAAPPEDWPAFLRSRGIPHLVLPRLDLGFGVDAAQFRLYRYPAPAEDETMGLFCDWHTADFFAADGGPHLAIGLRGPTEEAPHNGRGLAIGILANRTCLPDDPDNPVELFRGCPDPPGGPACFIEDFSRNDGVAPVRDWQLSDGLPLPGLHGNAVYRIELQVSAGHARAAIWKAGAPDARDGDKRYELIGATACSENAPGFSGDPCAPCPEHPRDSGIGNAFIGTGFADPGNNSWIDRICIAHWKTRGAAPFLAGDQPPGSTT